MEAVEERAEMAQMAPRTTSPPKPPAAERSILSKLAKAAMDLVVARAVMAVQALAVHRLEGFAKRASSTPSVR